MILSTLHKSDIPGGLKEYIVSQNIEYWSVRWGNDDLFDYAIMKRGVRKEARKLAEEGILKKTALREDRYMLTKKGEKAAEKAYTRQTLG
jgi:repressor of nif and glnA expression